jgi:hypothetical protein
MLVHMRTTITLDDGVLELARQRARRRGVTLSRVIQEAVQAALANDVEDAPPPFELITYGHPRGRAPSWSEINEVLDADDVALHRRND